MDAESASQKYSWLGAGASLTSGASGDNSWRGSGRPLPQHHLRAKQYGARGSAAAAAATPHPYPHVPRQMYGPGEPHTSLGTAAATATADKGGAAAAATSKDDELLRLYREAAGARAARDAALAALEAERRSHDATKMTVEALRSELAGERDVATRADGLMRKERKVLRSYQAAATRSGAEMEAMKQDNAWLLARLETLEEVLRRQQGGDASAACIAAASPTASPRRRHSGFHPKTEQGYDATGPPSILSVASVAAPGETASASVWDDGGSTTAATTAFDTPVRRVGGATVMSGGGDGRRLLLPPPAEQQRGGGVRSSVLFPPSHEYAGGGTPPRVGVDIVASLP